MAKPLNIILLERARSLIADKGYWCRGALARDASGTRVHPTASTARKWCAYGALLAAAHELTNDLGQAHSLAAEAARALRGTTSIVTVNDMFGHAAVLQRFETALAVAARS